MQRVERVCQSRSEMGPCKGPHVPYAADGPKHSKVSPGHWCSLQGVKIMICCCFQVRRFLFTNFPNVNMFLSDACLIFNTVIFLVSTFTGPWALALGPDRDTHKQASWQAAGQTGKAGHRGRDKAGTDKAVTDRQSRHRKKKERKGKGCRLSCFYTFGLRGGARLILYSTI